MKLTLTASGEVIIDTDDPGQAVAVVRGLRGSEPTKPAKPSRKKRVLAELETYEEPLTPKLVETWNWLVANDRAEGCHSKEIARGLQINDHTAVYRMGELVRKELAYRPSPGYFRAGSPPPPSASDRPKKKTAKRNRPARQEINEQEDQIVRLAAAKGGITAVQVSELLEMPNKTAYNRLYRLREKNRLWLSENGVFKASAHHNPNGVSEMAEPG